MGRRFGAACVFTADQRGGPQPLPPCCRLAWVDPRSDRRPRQLQRAAVRSSESPIPTWRAGSRQRDHLQSPRGKLPPSFQAREEAPPSARPTPAAGSKPSPLLRFQEQLPGCVPGAPRIQRPLSGSSRSATGACRGTGGRRYLNKQSDRCRMSCVGGGMAMGESAKSESPRHVTGHDSAPRCARVFPPDSRSLSALGCRRLRVPVAPGTVSLMRVG